MEAGATVFETPANAGGFAEECRRFIGAWSPAGLAFLALGLLLVNGI